METEKKNAERQQTAYGQNPHEINKERNLDLVAVREILLATILLVKNVVAECHSTIKTIFQQK